jgi:hypothetical protein
MRMAFMLDYAAPEADELASFLKAAQVGPPHTFLRCGLADLDLGQYNSESMREVGAVRLDQMVLLVNTTLLRAHLSVGVEQRSVFVNVHRSLAAPRVCTSG